MAFAQANSSVGSSWRIEVKFQVTMVTEDRSRKEGRGIVGFHGYRMDRIRCAACPSLERSDPGRSRRLPIKNKGTTFLSKKIFRFKNEMRFDFSLALNKHQISTEQFFHHRNM